jgi:hypothetical protein
MAAPVPTSLVFLSDLDGLPPDSKVRFLAWYVQSAMHHSPPSPSDPFSVLYYDPSSASLFVSHHFPRSSYQTVARINTDHVLESVRLSDLQVGSWINIIGYTSSRTLNPAYSFSVADPVVYSEIGVQATVLWNARELDIQNYERALTARKAAASVTIPP